MEKLTQKQIVYNRNKEVGYVDNFWAIDNYILRLGAIIYMLIKDGMRFDGKFGKTIGKDKPLWKNFYYIEKKFPEQKTLF
jgi:hypothetical protein